MINASKVPSTSSNLATSARYCHCSTECRAGPSSCWSATRTGGDRNEREPVIGLTIEAGEPLLSGVYVGVKEEKKMGRCSDVMEPIDASSWCTRKTRRHTRRDARFRLWLCTYRWEEG